MLSGMEKLEWWDYPMVKNSEDMYNRLDRIPACNRQTDGRQTTCHGVVRAMHVRRAVKTVQCSNLEERLPPSGIA